MYFTLLYENGVVVEKVNTAWTLQSQKNIRTARGNFEIISMLDVTGSNNMRRRLSDKEFHAEVKRTN